MYLHVSSFRSNVRVSPRISQQLFALILFQYRTVPSPIHFLHPFRFIRRLPSLALHHFLRFFVSIWEFPLHKHFFACILSEHLNSPHPVPGRRKNVPVQKKKAPRSKNAQPNVLSTYNKGVPPPPHGGKVHEAGARVQKKKHRVQKQFIWLSKKNSPGPTQIHAGPTKYPHRSQKKGAHVQKTCIPKKTPVLNIPAGCLSNPRFQRVQCQITVVLHLSQSSISLKSFRVLFTGYVKNLSGTLFFSPLSVLHNSCSEFGEVFVGTVFPSPLPSANMRPNLALEQD